MGLFSGIGKAVGGIFGGGGSKTSVTPKSNTDVSTTVNNLTDLKPLAEAFKGFTEQQTQAALLGLGIQAERQKQFNDLLNRGFDFIKRWLNFIAAGAAIYALIRFTRKKKRKK